MPGDRSIATTDIPPVRTGGHGGNGWCRGHGAGARAAVAPTGRARQNPIGGMSGRRHGCRVGSAVGAGTTAAPAKGRQQRSGRGCRMGGQQPGHLRSAGTESGMRTGPLAGGG